MLLICHFRIQIWRQRGKQSWRKSEARRRNLKRKSRRTFRSRKVENRKRSCSRENRRKRRRQHRHLPENLSPVWLCIYYKFYFYALTFSFWAAINIFVLISTPVKKKRELHKRTAFIDSVYRGATVSWGKKSLQIRLVISKSIYIISNSLPTDTENQGLGCKHSWIFNSVITAHAGIGCGSESREVGGWRDKQNHQSNAKNLQQQFLKARTC